MMYDTLLVERRGPVGWLIFNRPEAGNALDATMRGWNLPTTRMCASS
jgi:enoyl-CoA hydratase/carnithine racemase